MKILRRLRRKAKSSHSIRDYQQLVRNWMRRLPDDRTLALARAIGASSMEEFVAQGDGHVAVLRHYGLRDGMAVYDLGCGCGRTAQALRRTGWTGTYCGADVVPEFLAELSRQCPGYRTILNYSPSIVASDASLDLVFHWSVFTHLFPTEIFLYMEDAFRALRPGGKMIFSFMEFEDPAHDVIWEAALHALRHGGSAEHLETFLHRDWLRRFARDAGFSTPQFTDGADSTHHPPFWQSLAVMTKPS